MAAMLVDLPLGFADPVTTLDAVRARVRRAKGSGEADGGSMTGSVLAHVPHALVNTAVRAYGALPQRIITTVTTNVPGPDRVVRVLGRELLALHPYVPIGDRIRVGVAVTTYAATLSFGITYDLGSVPDADVVVDGIRSALTALTRRAACATPATPTGG
ncbi:WS/DGAT domain-containing protein [Jatrophihabitans fulvus]